MSEDLNAETENMNSNEILQPLLNARFEQLENGISADRIVGLLDYLIQALPGNGVKVVSLIGGAASGKSTIALALVEDLTADGCSVDVLATDDYVRGDRTWRWQQFEGKADVDPIGKYDFVLLNAKLAAIKGNSDPALTVAVPSYNQETGLAIDAGEENYLHRIGPVNIVIVEGDFDAVKQPDLTIFLHVPDDQRLEFRRTRDAVSRGGDMEKTTNSFNFRQRTQHFPHTLVAAKKADIIIYTDASSPEWTFSLYQQKPKRQFKDGTG